MDNTHNFAILTNGIDSNIEIIQHIETGYYNITKTAKLVADLKNTKLKIFQISLYYHKLLI
jgi:hypothetical protein